MATDYSILEQELTETKENLERKLHMNNVRRLFKKQQYLAKSVIQRKRIEILSKEAAELEATVATLYCPQYALRDNEIRLYLVYLLTMKDFFVRAVATKEECIEQLNLQIERQSRKLCAITRGLAKYVKNRPKDSQEFIHLENMSNRLEQTNKRICMMRQENREIMENIIDLRKFQKLFKTFEREFSRKITYFNQKGKELLEKAVSSYEEKDEFMSRKRVFEERRSQDLRKSAATENALNLCLQRTEKNEEFTNLQAVIRIDDRIAEASDMIEEGVTGLEPNLQAMDDLHTAISTAAGEDKSEKMEERFRVANDSIDMTFSYLDEVLKDINRLQGEINNFKKENKQLIESMRSYDRHLRKKIKVNQDEAEKDLENADEGSKMTDEMRNELQSVLDTVKRLYSICCPEDAFVLGEAPIDETNVIDYLQKMEKQVLDYLICLEYNKMKESSEEQKPVMLETEKDEVIEDEAAKIEDESFTQPRLLLSDTDLRSVVDLETKESFLDFESIREQLINDEVPSEEDENETNQ